VLGLSNFTLHSAATGQSLCWPILNQIVLVARRLDSCRYGQGLPKDGSGGTRGGLTTRLFRVIHQHFSSRRLNWANNRKEFFFASPSEVRSVLLKTPNPPLEALVGSHFRLDCDCESTGGVLSNAGDFNQSGAKTAKNAPRWGVFKFCESARTTKKKGRLLTGLQLRGKDLNLRPLGYEPNELPLLHPAITKINNYKARHTNRQWRGADSGIYSSVHPRNCWMEAE
jgi:hypothetical protein